VRYDDQVLDRGAAVAYDCRMVSTRTGWFISIEGGEGSGKSSVQAALGAALRARGRTVLLTREPGGTPLGEQIRALVLAETSIETELTELLLFEAARAQLVATVIRPALARAEIVICDRFAASSVAYQGFGRGLGRDLVERANAIATGGLRPHLTLLLDVPAAEGLARRAGTGVVNHFDVETLAFHERVRAGYHDLANDYPDTWRIIDASRSVVDVLADCEREVLALIGS
jgi:dTMP kinase